MLTRYPNFREQFTHNLALEIKSLHSRLLEASFYSCKDKVARLLLTMAHAYGQNNNKGQLQLDLRRKDLAQMAGISVATAIRTLAHFEKRGWVHVRYHTITILDEVALRAYNSPLSPELE